MNPPEWFAELNADRITRIEEFWALEWFKNGNEDNERMIEIHDDGDVVAVGRDYDEPDGMAFCEFKNAEENKEWLARFARVGWFWHLDT